MLGRRREGRGGGFLASSYFSKKRRKGKNEKSLRRQKIVEGGDGEKGYDVISSYFLSSRHRDTYIMRKEGKKPAVFLVH